MRYKLVYSIKNYKKNINTETQRHGVFLVNKNAKSVFPRVFLFLNARHGEKNFVF